MNLICTRYGSGIRCFISSASDLTRSKKESGTSKKAEIQHRRFNQLSHLHSFTKLFKTFCPCFVMLNECLGEFLH